jgi:hypothetical protein
MNGINNQRQEGVVTDGTQNFYTIPLTDKPYVLTRDMLLDATEPALHRRRHWDFPGLHFISFEKGLLRLTNSHMDASFELSIGITEHSLSVACSCGTAVETVCIHTYQALARLTWNDKECGFRHYMEGGMVETAFANKEFFNMGDTDEGLKVTLKKEMGTVFGLSTNVGKSLLSEALSLDGQTLPSEFAQKENALTYIIACPNRNESPPFILPCMGITDKKGDNIKFFQNFLTGVQLEFEPCLTNSQKELNTLCMEIYLLSEKLPGAIHAYQQNDFEKLAALFNLWQKAFQHLMTEKFVFSYRLYKKRELRSKPEKLKCLRINLSHELPVLSFRLLDRGKIFQLKLDISVGNKRLQQFDATQLFLIKNGDDIYFIQSPRDVAVLGWMQRFGQHLAVFPHHMDGFEREVLGPLRKYYPIVLEKAPPLPMPEKNKKQKP